MDYARFEMIRLEHGHGNNEWHPMNEVPHDAAQNDPEREWGRHRIFKCSTCEDEIRIATPENQQRGR